MGSRVSTISFPPSSDGGRSPFVSFNGYNLTRESLDQVRTMVLKNCEEELTGKPVSLLQPESPPPVVTETSPVSNHKEPMVSLMPSRITYKGRDDPPTMRLLKVRNRHDSFGRTSMVKDTNVLSNLTVISRNLSTKPYQSTLNDSHLKRRGAGRSLNQEDNRESNTPSKNTPMNALYTLPKISN